MFSKKKTSTSNNIAEFETSCQRNAFRISEYLEKSVIADLDGIPIKISDISAGGISFTSHFIETGAKGFLHLILKAKKTYLVEAEIEIIAKSEPDTCHCKYTKISHENAEYLHQFVLEMQLLKNTEHK